MGICVFSKCCECADTLAQDPEETEEPITEILHYLKALECTGAASMIGDEMRVVVHKDNPIESLLDMNEELFESRWISIDDNYLLVEQCVLEFFKAHFEFRLQEELNSNTNATIRSFKSARSSGKSLIHVD